MSEHVTNSSCPSCVSMLVSYRLYPEACLGMSRAICSIRNEKSRYAASSPICLSSDCRVVLSASQYLHARHTVRPDTAGCCTCPTPAQPAPPTVAARHPCYSARRYTAPVSVRMLTVRLIDHRRNPAHFHVAEVQHIAPRQHSPQAPTHRTPSLPRPKVSPRTPCAPA